MNGVIGYLGQLAAQPLCKIAAGALLDASRLILVYVGAELFYAVCSASRAGNALTRLCRRIPGLRRLDPGLALSLCLGFFPRTFALFKQGLEAARLRSYGRRLPRLDSSVILLSGLIVAALRRAFNTAEALCLRAYSREREIEGEALSLTDALCLMACAGLFAL
jgi:energy-coupling factor transporter transmembrane protein EcfT